MSNLHRFLFVVFLVFLIALRVLLHLKTPNNQIVPKGTQIKFEATVKNEPKISDKNQVISIADGKIYTELYPRYAVGDKLLVEGEFDEGGRMFRGKLQKIGEVSGLGSFRSKVRQLISQNIQGLLPVREATLVAGTVLGLDSIDKNFHDELVKTGTIHVVVVSGQNLMIVAALFLAMGPIVGRRRSLVIAVAAVLAYAFLTGFEPPVVRASIMVLVSTIAVFLGRENDTLWSLFVAAAVMVLIWPAALFEISFQLTFAATLGIMTLGRIISNLFFDSKLAQSEQFRILNLAAIPISAYVFTAPIILYYFGGVSPVAPIANILVAEVVAPIMVLGFLVCAVSLVFMPLAQILAYFAYVPAFYFSQVVSVFAKIPIEQITFGKGNLVFVVGFYVVILGVIRIFTNKSKLD